MRVGTVYAPGPERDHSSYWSRYAERKRRRPTTPFTLDWGDGTSSNGFFPRQHSYSQIKNYTVTVTAHYSGGATDSAQILARLVAPSIQPVALPSGFGVTIPSSGPLPTSRLLYPVPATLTPFGASDFGTVSRSAMEYVLSTVAATEKDLINSNVALVNGGFAQLWKDPARRPYGGRTPSGCYSR